MLGLQLQGLIQTFHAEDVLDIIVVAFMLYWAYVAIRNTRAIALVKGLIILGIIDIVSHELNLHVVSWILQQGMTMIMVALPIVFQPELRRWLEQIGRGSFFSSNSEAPEKDIDAMIAEVMAASKVMARAHIGALIVFERDVRLGDIIDTGIQIDGIVSRELLNNIFIPNTPLHDGAVVIRKSRIMAAGCLLPLTQNRSLSTELGTRHRAAIGLSEQADAVVLVVSEETGKISYTYGGHIYRELPEQQMRDSLRAFLLQPKSMWAGFWKIGGRR